MLNGLSPILLYSLCILAFLWSVFKNPIAGIYYLVPLIPLQTVRYWMIGYPLGQSVVDLSLLGVIIGLLRLRQPLFPKTPWNSLLLTYGIFTYASLFIGSFYLESALPLLPTDPRFLDWKDYMTMPLILFLTAAAVKDKRQIRILIVLMCLSLFMMARSFYGTVEGRDFSHYSDDLRNEGSMGYAGVNGLAAFEAQATMFILALAVFEKKLLYKFGYLGVAAASGLCMMYSLSRAGYLAFAAGWLFLGAVKQRKLLGLLVVFCLVGTALIPNAVRSRVLMTYDGGGELDHSSETRVNLWEEAIEAFEAHPLFGTGFDTYAYGTHATTYKDTHNFFVKVLTETGVVGMAIFLWLLGGMFLGGFRLFRHATDPLYKSLGLGLAVWVVCAAVANFFGDRWHFLQVNGYMWVVAGLVARGWLLTEAKESPTDEETGEDVAESPDGASQLQPQPAGAA
jgi:putative inorganic carbon (hco3(-)) transporter